jgi:Ca2+-dependent lipid-binding protein
MSRDDMKEFARFFAVTFSLWLVGYMHFSFAWIVMILMVFVSWQFEIEKKSKHRDNMAQAHMSSFIHKFENMPSWVYFSDKEHAEWINKILVQMWPYLGDMVCDILKNTVEPEMQKNLPKALQTLYFDKITLGNQPPVIKSVSSYDTRDKTGSFIMDLDIKYEGDAQVKLSVKSVKLGLTNFQLNGILRVIFKPLVSNYNPIGGVTVFFLNRPKTKFDLTNLLNVLDFPGLKSTLRRIVNDTLASFVVLPNRVAVPLAEGVDGSDLQYPIPEGVLRVKIVEARDLMAKDFGFGKKGKSDPYAILEIGAQRFRSKVQKNNLDPTWNETFEAFVDNSEGQDIEITVWDEDTSSKDSNIGSIEASIASAVEQGKHDIWLPLEGVKQGRVHLLLSWFPLSDNAAHRLQAEHQEDSVAALVVKVISAHHLPVNKKPTLNSVFCEVTVVGTTLKTFVAYGEKLEWKQGLRFLLKNPDTNEAKIKVIDSKGNRCLGLLKYNIKDLLQKRGMSEERSFVLEESGEKSTITCRFTLRMLGLPGLIKIEEVDMAGVADSTER